MRSLIAFFSLLYIAGYAESSEYEFVNFGRAIPLESVQEVNQHSSPPRYVYRMPDGGNITLTNRIIAKADNALSRVELGSLLPGIAKVQKIAPLPDASIFLLQTESHLDPIGFARELGKHQAIHYAQPDILQQGIQHALKTSDASYKKAPSFDLEEIWKITKGQGVKIAIIDDGFNLDHPEFAQIDVSFSYDSDLRVLGAKPRLSADRHGTSMASVIFAAHDNTGIDGVAPEASLIAIRQTSLWTSDMVLAFSVAKLSGADIVNCSWLLPLMLEPLADTMRDIVRNGREGKGGVIVVAAGNHGGEVVDHNALAEVDGVLVVGAVLLNGRMASFSNRGAGVDLLGPARLKTAIVSQKGLYSIALREGTSIATAFVAGVVALMLSSNPMLNFGEIELILKRASTESREGLPIVDVNAVLIDSLPGGGS